MALPDELLKSWDPLLSGESLPDLDVLLPDELLRAWDLPLLRDELLLERDDPRLPEAAPSEMELPLFPDLSKAKAVNHDGAYSPSMANRVEGGITPSPLPLHRTYRSGIRRYIVTWFQVLPR